MSHLAAEAADGSALDRLADILLRSDVPTDLREAARDIHSLLLAAAMAGRPDETLDRDDTVLPDGDAISPESAARCVLDYTRTSRFLRGMRLALRPRSNASPSGRSTYSTPVAGHLRPSGFF